MASLIILDAADVARVSTALEAALSGSGSAVLVRDLRAARLAGEGRELPADTELPAGTALLVQTSGSSGNPKTVVLSADALRASSAAVLERLGGPGQWLLALPLSYIAGLSVLVRSIVANIPPASMPSGPFDPQRFLETAGSMTARRRYTSLVPVQLIRILDFIEAHPEQVEVVRRFDAVLIGGQMLERTLADRARQLGMAIIETYGSSETSGGCVYDGLPLAGTSVRIDENGEILLAAPMLATGYLDAQLTAEKFIERDGTRWYRSGDAGSFDGRELRVSGRMDRVIISGGIKISLDDVAAVARRVAGVTDAFAVNIPDSEWGERPGVVVTVDWDLFARNSNPVRGADTVYSAVYGAVQESLGRAAAPKRVEVVHHIPFLESGKPDYVSLRNLCL